MYKEYNGYLVYDSGEIFSIKSDKYLSHDVSKAGYHSVTLFISGKRVVWKVHRLVASMFIPNLCDLPQINHINGDKSNNHISNLEWCTSYHNNKHARDTGLNDISTANARRWKDNTFKERTAKIISEARTGLYTGRDNPNFRYMLDVDGKLMTVDEASVYFDLNKHTMRNNVLKLRHGSSTAFTRKHNITLVSTLKTSIDYSERK